MDAAHKIVTRLPLEGLWNEKGSLAAARRKTLTEEEIAGLLRAGPVHFVVADAGASLRWIPVEDRFSFWKDEARPHLAQPGSRAVLDSFPNNYCYLASEWEADGGDSKTVVLERHH